MTEGRVEPMSDAPVDLRVALWNACPHQAKYGDDGELQCNGIDFRRDPAEVLGHHVREAITECLTALMPAPVDRVGGEDDR